MAERNLQWRDAEWVVAAGPDGKLSAESVTHALLIDIRATLRQIRSMMKFFTVLAIIGLALGVLVSLVSFAK